MWFNKIIQTLLQSPLHPILSGSMMLITYQGHKSGKTYCIPINYVREEQDLWAVSLRERTWWRNLNNGQTVTLHLQGHDLPAQGEVYDTEVALQKFLHIAPQYARYWGVKTPADLQALAQKHVLIRFHPPRS